VAVIAVGITASIRIAEVGFTTITMPTLPMMIARNGSACLASACLLRDDSFDDVEVGLRRAGLDRASSSLCPCCQSGWNDGDGTSVRKVRVKRRTPATAENGATKGVDRQHHRRQQDREDEIAMNGRNVIERAAAGLRSAAEASSEMVGKGKRLRSVGQHPKHFSVRACVRAAVYGSETDGRLSPVSLTLFALETKY
jgi:hypothetical protein